MILFRRLTPRLSAALFACAALPAFTTPASAQTFTFTLESASNAQSVSPGETVSWSIRIVGDADSLGLGGFTVDLAQDASNPQTIEIPSASGVPAAMAGFSRPDGISNPSPGGITPGYCGTPVGGAGNKNLIEIGGLQNTFGVSGGSIGQDTTVDSGITLGPGGQVVASGSFPAPDSPGAYTFRLENAFANGLLQVNAAPAVSAAVPCDALADSSITFTVCCLADFNCSGGTPDDTDTADFFQAWNNGDESADVNHSGGTPDDTDIAVFFSHWNGGC